MEVRRRLRRNKLLNDVRDTETLITRGEDTIKRLRNSQMGEVYVKNQISKIKSSNEEKCKLLEKLKTDLIAIDKGVLDTEINKEYSDTSKKIQKIRKEKAKMKAIKKEENDEKKEVSKEYWKGIISASRSHRQKEKDVKYAYKYFNKVIDSLPSYMQNNLADMPNNKGYIWRGIHFYGSLPEQRGPRVMFEKQRGGKLVIHEYTDTEYRRYEKHGKDRKQLVHRSPKRKVKVETSLMDYCVKK